MKWNHKLNTVLGLCVALAVSASLVFADAEKDAKKRAEIDAMADATMKGLFESSPDAKKLHKKAVGHAVFSNVKIALGFSGGGGQGVAVPKEGKPVYMNMGTAGVGFGIGAQKYQVVFFFQTEKVFKSFVDKGWQADASAQAAAGDEGANLGATFRNGVAIYQMTDKGLMASADITGTKYWKSDDLNKGVSKEESKEDSKEESKEEPEEDSKEESKKDD